MVRDGFFRDGKHRTFIDTGMEYFVTVTGTYDTDSQIALMDEIISLFEDEIGFNVYQTRDKDLDEVNTYISESDLLLCVVNSNFDPVPYIEVGLAFANYVPVVFYAYDSIDDSNSKIQEISSLICETRDSLKKNLSNEKKVFDLINRIGEFADEKENDGKSIWL